MLIIIPHQLSASHLGNSIREESSTPQEVFDSRASTGTIWSQNSSAQVLAPFLPDRWQVGSLVDHRPRWCLLSVHPPQEESSGSGTIWIGWLDPWLTSRLLTGAPGTIQRDYLDPCCFLQLIRVFMNWSLSDHSHTSKLPWKNLPGGNFQSPPLPSGTGSQRGALHHMSPHSPMNTTKAHELQL